MNILYLYQKTTPPEDITWALMELGHHVSLINSFLSDSFENDECCFEMTQIFEKENIDAVLTFNYYPYVSDTCEQYHIPYIAWLFDAPVMYAYTNSILNECNYIFSFDKSFYEDLKALGIKNIYHLPLCANMKRLNSLSITDDDLAKYNHDVSFVGRLFQDNSYNNYYNSISNEFHEYFNQLFQLQFMKRDDDILSAYLSDTAVDYIKKLANYDFLSSYPLCEEKKCFSYLFLHRKFTELERFSTLKYISENIKLDMYTDSNTDLLLEVVNHGPIDPYIEAHKLFFSCKINLNFTQLSIRSGIPLRAFDIMSSGGFLLSNAQTELNDLFIPDVDYVAYNSIEEIPDIINYYLQHENQRKEIAYNGYTKISEQHTYTHRVDYILKTVF